MNTNQSRLLGWSLYSFFLISYCVALYDPTWRNNAILGWIVGFDVFLSWLSVVTLSVVVFGVRRSVEFSQTVRDQATTPDSLKVNLLILSTSVRPMMLVSVIAAAASNYVLFQIGFEMAALACFLATLAMILVRLTIDPKPEVLKIWK
jgi:hypothetical protein